jgi:hypothetical protein
MRETAILTFTKPKLSPRILLMTLGVFFGVLFSVFVLSGHAFAAPPPFSVGGGDGSPGGGGQTTQPPGGGSSGGHSKGEVKFANSAPYDANNHNFNVSCANWSGSGSYQANASCNVGKTDIQRNSNVPGGYVCGASAIYACDNLSAGGSQAANIYRGGDPQVCGPSGSKSADGQTWHVSISKITRTVQTWDGEKWVQTANFVWSQTVRVSFVGCMYPRSAFSYETCYFNYNGNSYYSTNRGTISGGGAFFKARPKQAGDPPVPTGGSGSTPPNCASHNARVDFQVYPNDLGYYRLRVTWNYKKFTNEKWIGSITGAVLKDNWSQGGTLSGSATTYYSYSCNPSGSAAEGAFNSAGALPNRDAYLNPAKCEVANKWECVLSTPTTIGLDKAAVAAGKISPTSPTSIMRNGQKVPLNWSKVSIIDQTGGGRVDVTNGNTGPGVRKISNISYYEAVAANASPFLGKNPKDVNSGNQYFKKYTKVNSNTVSPFGQWKSQNNQHLDEGVAFYWASTDSAHPWKATRVYKVSGEFRVPKAVSIGTGGAQVSGYKWLSGQYDCLKYKYNSNGSRVSQGLLTGQTNNLSVVRSTNDK